MSQKTAPEWFLDRDDGSAIAQGPYTRDQLKALLDRREIQPVDWVSSKSGGGKRIRVTELFVESPAGQLMDALKVARDKRTGKPVSTLASASTPGKSGGGLLKWGIMIALLAG